METNNATNWSEELEFVQVMRNKSYHEVLNFSQIRSYICAPMKPAIAKSVLPRNFTINMTTKAE